MDYNEYISVTHQLPWYVDSHLSHSYLSICLYCSTYSLFPSSFFLSLSCSLHSLPLTPFSFYYLLPFLSLYRCSVKLSLSLSLSHCVSLIVFVSVFLSVTLSLYLSIYSFSFSFSISRYIIPPAFVFICLTIYVPPLLLSSLIFVCTPRTLICNLALHLFCNAYYNSLNEVLFFFVVDIFSIVSY